MDFVNEVSNDPNGSKVPRNGKIPLFWILDLLHFYSDFFGVDPTEIEMKRELNWEKYGAQKAYNFIVFYLKRFFKLETCFLQPRNGVFIVWQKSENPPPPPRKNSRSAPAATYCNISPGCTCCCLILLLVMIYDQWRSRCHSRRSSRMTVGCCSWTWATPTRDSTSNYPKYQSVNSKHYSREPNTPVYPSRFLTGEVLVFNYKSK